MVWVGMEARPSQLQKARQGPGQYHRHPSEVHSGGAGLTTEGTTEAEAERKNSHELIWIYPNKDKMLFPIYLCQRK